MKLKIHGLASATGYSNVRAFNKRVLTLKYVSCSVLIIAISISGCMARPDASEYDRPLTTAMDPASPSQLQSIISPQIQAHPGLSGLHAITHGGDALTLRLEMIEAAQHTLDVQYYSIQNDKTGKLLLEALLKAADRGVRVRILVDDITIKKSDDVWSLLNAHKHIEMRVFNPFATKDQPLLSRVGRVFTDLGHFLRRMHNKAFIADNQVAMVGGRNLGDAYFDSSHDFNFRDVDILFTGPLVPEMSKNFDRYWNGKEAYPITALRKSDTKKPLEDVRQELKDHWQQALDDGTLVLPLLTTQLQSANFKMLWAKAELAADSPTKIEQPREQADSKPAGQIEKLAATAQHEFIAVTPYFVPGEDGVAWIKNLIARGVKVQILTNSLAATDVVAVHAGYRRYREEVVKDGVELFELKPTPGKHPRSGRFASASRVSLHTKLYIIDRRDIVIGTMNFDPRSIELNTELGIVIHSPELAAEIVDMFQRAASPASSYHVILANPNSSNLKWTAEENGQKEDFDSEPKASLWRTIEVNLYALLPFEDLL